MAKVGRFVTDPKAGAYCQITLDSGEKIIVNHDKGGFKGGMLTIEVLEAHGLQLRSNLHLPPRQRRRSDGPHPAHPGRPPGQRRSDPARRIRRVLQGLRLGGGGQGQMRSAGGSEWRGR